MWYHWNSLDYELQCQTRFSAQNYSHNPALEYVTIQLNQSYKEGYNVVLYNGIGQKIKEKKITGEKTQLSTGSYLPGYHKLVLYHNNVKITSLNLVIQ